MQRLLKHAGQAYDAVIASEIIEHLPDPERFCEALAGLTKPAGLVIVSTLSRTPRSYVQAILGAEKLLQLLPNGTHDWNKFISPGTYSTSTAALLAQFSHRQFQNRDAEMLQMLFYILRDAATSF